MKIRMANENDIQHGISQIMEAIKEFPEFKVEGFIVPMNYYKQLIHSCFKNGMIIVAEDNGKIIGCLMSIFNKNIFTGLNELLTIVTWVHKNRRNSSAFYRMHKLYKQEYKKLIKQNKIHRVLIYSLPNKTNIKLEKLGYNIVETAYEWR